MALTLPTSPNPTTQPQSILTDPPPPPPSSSSPEAGKDTELHEANLKLKEELKAANDAATKLRQLYMSVEGLNDAAENSEGFGGLAAPSVPSRRTKRQVSEG